MSTDAFISYSRRDSAFVARLAAGLEAEGTSTWVDTDGLADGEVFPRAIRQAIEGSDSFVFVITPESAASQYCASEVDHARDLGKRIVPVLREPVPDEALPEEIRDRNWIPFDADAQFDVALGRLKTALDTDLEHVRSHTRWLVRAVDWDESGRDGSRLLRGTELRTAEDWLSAAAADADPAPTPLQRSYVLAGRRAAQRRQRALVGSSLAVTVVALGLLVFALIARHQAVDGRITARAQALAAQSAAQLSNDAQVGLGLAQRSVGTKPTSDGLFSLRQALDGSPLLTDLPTQPAVTSGCWGPTVAFSPDGRQVAEGLCRGAKVFDVATRKLLHSVTSPRPSTALYTPDGTQLAVLVDQTVQLLDPTTFARRRTIALPHEFRKDRPDPNVAVVKQLAFSPDGRRLASITGDVVGLVDVPTGKARGLYLPPSYMSVAFSPDGRTVYVGSTHGNTTVLDFATGRTLRQLRTPPSIYPGQEQQFVAATPDGRAAVLASWVGDGTTAAYLYDARTGRRGERILSVPSNYISSLALSPDGTRVAVGLNDGTGGVWSVRTHQQIVTFQGQSQRITGVAFRADGQAVAAVSADGSGRIWRAHGGEERYLEAPPGAAPPSAIGGGKLSIARPRADGAADLWRWDLRSGRQLATWSPRGGTPILSTDGTQLGLTSGGADPSFQVLDVATRRRVVAPFPVGPTLGTTWSADRSKLMVVAARDVPTVGMVASGLAVFDLARGGRRTTLKTGESRCGGYQAIALSDDGLRAAAASPCGELGIWALPTGRRLRTVTTDDPVSLVALDAHGRRLAIGTYDSRALLLDVATGKSIRTLVGHTKGVDGIAWSPDGRRLLTSSDDLTARLWDAGTGAELHRIPLPSITASAAFSATGDQISVIDGDGSVRVWSTCEACGDAPALLKLAGPRLTTNPTPLERAYLGR